MKQRLQYIAVSLVFFLASASAQPTSDKFFNTLLQKLDTTTQLDQQQNQQREQAFLEQKEQQAALLKQAQSENQALQKRLQALEKQWRENETQLAQLEKTHQRRAGNLLEMEGMFKQSSNEFFSVVSNSMVQFHLPDWQLQRDRLSAQQGLPSLEMVETLWQLMLKYLLVQEQTMRFSSKVIQLDGSLKQQDVVTIGPFTALSDDGFLNYLPSEHRLAVLERQPAARLVAAAQDYFATQEGILAAPLDPSRGALLSLLITTPSLEERLHQGGWIGYVIILIAMFGLLVAMWRWWVLRSTRRGIRWQEKNMQQLGDNPLARLFAVYQSNRDDSTDSLEIKLDEAMTQEISGLDTGLMMLKVFTVITPLLGLLGTVVGMLETFQAITLFGSGDPKLMAGGISQALVTTAMGLMAAVPLLLIYTYLSSQSRMLQDILQEQSIGLLAQHANKDA